jgi:predicted RNase H-like nuclease
MTTIAGIDGCRAGWLCVFQQPRAAEVFAEIADVFAAAPELQVLAIDVPIGLTEAGARECDRAARRRLGPGRASSVFPAPIRPALHATTYLAACDAAFRAHGKKLSKQSWAIYPKIREVDDFLRRRPELRDRVHEVHPEVTFAEWNGSAIVESKKRRAGFALRHELVTGISATAHTRRFASVTRARTSRTTTSSTHLLRSGPPSASCAALRDRCPPSRGSTRRGCRCES